MSDRSFDWLNQGLRDLEQAKDSRRAERHEWGWFAAHQSAEKAVKALPAKNPGEWQVAERRDRALEVSTQGSAPAAPGVRR